jgi:hypothetical protein
MYAFRSCIDVCLDERKSDQNLVLQKHIVQDKNIDTRPV